MQLLEQRISQIRYSYNFTIRAFAYASWKMQQIFTWTTYSSLGRTFTSRHLSKHKTRKQPTTLVQQHHSLQQQTVCCSSPTLPTHSSRWSGLFHFQLFSKPFWVSGRSAYPSYKNFLQPFSHTPHCPIVPQNVAYLSDCLRNASGRNSKYLHILADLLTHWQTDNQSCNKCAYNGNNCNGSCTSSSLMLSVLWNNSKVERRIVARSLRRLPQRICCWS